MGSYADHIRERAREIEQKKSQEAPAQDYSALTEDKAFEADAEMPSGFREGKDLAQLTKNLHTEKDKSDKTKSKERNESSQIPSEASGYVYEAGKSLLKGIISPVVTLFKSPKNFITGAGAVALIGFASAATGGAIVPFVLGAGGLLGAYQAYKFREEHKAATNDDERIASYYHLGESITTLGVTAFATFGHFGLSAVVAEEAAIVQSALEASEASSAAVLERELAASAAAVTVEAETAGATAAEALEATEANAARRTAQSAAAAESRVLSNARQTGRTLGDLLNPHPESISEIEVASAKKVTKAASSASQQAPTMWSSWGKFFAGIGEWLSTQNKQPA